MRMSSAGSLRLLLLVCLGSAGCGEDEEVPGPVAVAGSDRTVAKGSHVTLDGTDSDGAGTLTYAWALSVPDGSAAALLRADTAATSFTPDREGMYVATLVVSSGALTSPPDSVVIVAENTPPTGNAGPDATAHTGSPFRLQGRATDPTDDPIRFRWSILSAPPGSTAVLDDPTIAAPTLIPDRNGKYELELVVGDESLDGAADRVEVDSAGLLEHSVVDAEYSRPLERLIMASDAPDGLFIADPVEGTETFVALPAPPTSVSVGPDGTHAAVGHDGSVSYVRLTDGTVLQTFPVTTSVHDVVLAGNGFAYAVPGESGGNEIRCLDLSTGIETLAGGFKFFSESRAKLHPSGTVMYHSMPSNFSVSDIAKWDISSGTAEYLYDSPYFGEFQGCGDLWISEDGQRIFTRCGVAFQSSTTPAADMLAVGSLGGVDFVLHVDQSSVANKVVAIPDTDANPFGDPSLEHTVRLYRSDSLAFERRIELLSVVAGGAVHDLDGRFAFLSADGARLFIIVQASDEAGAGALALLVHQL
jgi:chitinase